MIRCTDYTNNYKCFYIRVYSKLNTYLSDKLSQTKVEYSQRNHSKLIAKYCQRTNFKEKTEQNLKIYAKKTYFYSKIYFERQLNKIREFLTNRILNVI